VKRPKLTEKRKSMGLSQVALSERLGISFEHIRSLEYGRSNPSVQLMMKICSELHADPKVLFPDLME
jgi:transcriptional regulator with XRE-family HTH domain